MKIKTGEMSKFKSKEARELYENRVAVVIDEAMMSCAGMRYETIIEGRTGLADMSDSDLLEFGRGAWDVAPAGELK